MSSATKNDGYIHYDHESRIVRLETTIENINQTLIRIETKTDKLSSRIWANFYWTIGGFASILYVLAHGFHWI
jgi:hypothetical protein